MEGFSVTVSEAMRTIVGACQTPVVVLLLVATVFAVGCIGSVVAEFFTEHRRFKVFLPQLVDELKAAGRASREVIEASGLLMRQKRYLIELTRHPEVTDTMRESLAVGLEYQEQRRYDGIVKVTDIVSRIAPMLGLLGTLIPLGPGILALGEGDTVALSASLLIAFDTTALGLMVAGVALIVSAIRKRWYRDYMVAYDAATECVLEMQAVGVRGPHPAAASSDSRQRRDGDPGKGAGKGSDKSVGKGLGGTRTWTGSVPSPDGGPVSAVPDASGAPSTPAPAAPGAPGGSASAPADPGATVPGWPPPSEGGAR